MRIFGSNPFARGIPFNQPVAPPSMPRNTAAGPGQPNQDVFMPAMPPPPGGPGAGEPGSVMGGGWGRLLGPALSTLIGAAIEKLLSKLFGDQAPTSADGGAGSSTATDASGTSGVQGTDSLGGQSSTYGSTGVGRGKDAGKNTWRIPKTGPSFGKSLKVVFSDGYTVTVPDTTKRFTNSDGFIFRPGIGSKESGTGTSHNGVFLVGPKGHQATSATLYY
ncbi:MAG: hypothetical protein HY901_11510 [Deltaproteobacteria bacterium]|nr:hypothetical protein [Deltaproteobacteria bacterium]